MMLAKREDYAIGEIREHCTKEGALALADRIRHYWHMRGRFVKIETFWVKGTGTLSGGYWCIRSDIVNGLPSAQNKAAI